jgi:hypothetical protein
MQWLPVEDTRSAIGNAVEPLCSWLTVAEDTLHSSTWSPPYNVAKSVGCEGHQPKFSRDDCVVATGEMTGYREELVD